MDLCCLRSKVVERGAEGIKEPVRTYAARGLESSKASRQRHKGACRDLGCPRFIVVEGEPPKA